jgi:transcriptional regulator
MSLYTPAHFARSGQAAATRLMRDHPFATVVTPTADEPAISHLPLLHVAEGGEQGTLLGHFARANPHWQLARTRETIAVFHGPHAYISPMWYLAPTKAVPTWNYAAVHAHGTLAIDDTPEAARRVLDALAQHFEAGRPAPWDMGLMGERERTAMIGGIVAFRMPIARLETKFKLSQNRTPEDRARVIAALAADAHPDSAATAAWMREYSPP